MRRSPQEAIDRRRNTLRGVFFMTILATLPLYLLGFYWWGTAPDPHRKTATPTEEEITMTPIEGVPTNTLMPTWTPRATSTSAPLGPTPYQYVPPPTSPPTSAFIPSATIGPSLTPFPTDTSAPPPSVTPTVYIPPSVTPVPTATTEPSTTEPPTTEPPTAPPAATDTPFLPPTDTPEGSSQLPPPEETQSAGP